MDRRSIWIWLAIALTVGFGIESLKRAAPKAVRHSRLADLDENEIHERTPEKIGRLNPANSPAAPMSAAIGGPSLPLLPAPPAAKTIIAAGKAPAKKVAKKDDKKKKKPAMPVAVAPPATPPTDDKAKKTDDASAPDSGLGQASPAPGGGAPSGLPTSLQEWLSYMLASADMTRAQFFLAQYKAGLVTADVFYQVDQQMLADPRQEMAPRGLDVAFVHDERAEFRGPRRVPRPQPRRTGSFRSAKLSARVCLAAEPNDRESGFAGDESARRRDASD